MSIQVNDFQWDPGKNDAESLKLLESSRDEWQKIAQKAIAKLKALSKAQEPRVMTLEEVEQHNNQDGCVWFEQPTYNAVAAFVRKDDEDYTEIISPYLLGEPINHGYMANRFYGKAWRCWTSRPDQATREATQWTAQN